MATSESRRRQVRQLVLEAARVKANDALTLQNEECKCELFAPFSPSPIEVIDAVWEKLLRNNLHLMPGDLLVDLGCGDGRWLVSGAQRFGCNALGVELDEKLVQRARQEVVSHNLQLQIQVDHGDVLLADISSGKLVIVYAFAESLVGIAERLKQQLKEDANVLSIGFRIPEWKPHWSEKEGGLRWYLYRMSDCN